MEFVDRFRCARQLDFCDVTWDDSERDRQPRTRGYSSTINAVAAHGCTDNALLCLQSLGVGTNLGGLQELLDGDQITLNDVVVNVAAAFRSAAFLPRFKHIGMTCDLECELQCSTECYLCGT